MLDIVRTGCSRSFWHFFIFYIYIHTVENRKSQSMASAFFVYVFIWFENVSWSYDGIEKSVSAGRKKSVRKYSEKMGDDCTILLNSKSNDKSLH